jgi:hypothetical protein
MIPQIEITILSLEQARDALKDFSKIAPSGTHRQIIQSIYEIDRTISQLRIIEGSDNE